jgi:hypothetical protein
MSITDRAVEMIAWFDSKGEIHPIRFRLTDESANTFVVSVKKILDRRLERQSGSYLAVFDCVSSSKKNQEKSYRLKYEMNSCKWYLVTDK